MCIIFQGLSALVLFSLKRSLVIFARKHTSQSLIISLNFTSRSKASLFCRCLRYLRHGWHKHTYQSIPGLNPTWLCGSSITVSFSASISNSTKSLSEFNLRTLFSSILSTRSQSGHSILVLSWNIFITFSPRRMCYGLIHWNSFRSLYGYYIWKIPIFVLFYLFSWKQR